MILNKITPWSVVLKDSIQMDSTIIKIVDLGHITNPIMESFNALLFAIGKEELKDIGMLQ
jgi:hypothetical protein